MKVSKEIISYTVGCDIHDYIFKKANFLTKFVKFCATKISDYMVIYELCIRIYSDMGEFVCRPIAT